MAGSGAEISSMGAGIAEVAVGGAGTVLASMNNVFKAAQEDLAAVIPFSAVGKSPSKVNRC